MNKLNVLGIHISYNKNEEIITNFSLSATSGDIILIEGRNGIGKTSLLKSIAGIIKPQKGTITINNKDIFSIPLNKRKGLVVFAQQSPHYSSPIKVIEFLEMALHNNNTYTNRRRMLKYINLLQIQEILNKPLNLLSEGQKKIALLCRTFIQGSSVILLDEPDAFLDSYNQNLISNSILEITREGKIVILVSHNKSFYSKLYTRKVSILSSSEFLFESVDSELEFKFNTKEVMSL
ncbi:MAG: ABC transporter ATP-binding protein [Brevinematales bacterium]|nr:ABC transporter ATP-binding protein [Brevinematales bacterium]